MLNFRMCVVALTLAVVAAGSVAADPPAGDLTADGLGVLRIGMREPEVLKLSSLTDGAKTHDKYWQACHMLYEMVGGKTGRVWSAMIEDGQLTRITLSGPAANRTDAGIGIGSTEAEVTRAYGGLESRKNPYQDPPFHDLYFQPEGPRGSGLRFMIDDKGKVFVIHAGEQSIGYAENCE